MSTVKIQTSKQWVLPPRPKPGRKPSLDTPTTKRKAQNRAAQRAFRERKANKIQELEQTLSALKNERNKVDIALTNAQNDNNILNKNLQAVFAENKSLHIKCKQLQSQLSLNQCPTCVQEGNKEGSTASNELVSSLKARVAYLENLVRDKNVYIKSLQASNSTSYLNIGSPNGQISASFTPQIATSPDTFASSANHPSSGSVSSMPTPSSQQTSPFTGGPDDNCGACEKDDCICETIGIKSSATKADKIIEETKTTAPGLVSLKRKPSVSEIDFTSQFGASSKQEKLTRLIQKSREKKTKLEEKKSSPDIFNNSDLFKSIVTEENSTIDPCGFCSEDSPCVCRETSQDSSGHLKYTSISSPRSRVRSRRASLGVSNGKSSLIAAVNEEYRQKQAKKKQEKHQISFDRKTIKSSCTGNPGTCLQCQTDPMTTLFCTAIASKVSDERSRPMKSTAAPPRITRRSFSGTLTKLPDIAAPSDPVVSKSFENSSTVNALNGRQLFIPCSDAYKTLSRHHSFNRMDFNTLVGKLTTKGMSVEVQSVISVLKEMDKKSMNGDDGVKEKTL